jgi:AraC family transcriptional regulator of adaptative response/methylated-DNA-[protein]-cysteine methyltransferase
MNQSLFTDAQLPSFDEMYAALTERNSEYEGVFFVGVRTTGIFCRPTCSARKPKRENVQFYLTATDCLSAGFRPCKKCRPLEVFGAAPKWLTDFLVEVESDRSRRWSDIELKEHGIQPEKIRRWFKSHHGMTFQSYLRSRRLADAMGQIQVGKSVTGAAFDNGYQSLSGFRDAFQKWCGEAPTRIDKDALPLTINRIPTPLGPMVAAADDESVWLLEFADRRMLETQFKRLIKYTSRPLATGSNDLLVELTVQLKEYFEGRRTEFDLPLSYPGTEFQTKVWGQLRKIPYGTTLSYEGLARKIGKKGAQRAVGRANGDNRLALLIPCHRVIRSDGTLSGYAGGLWRKQRLLDIERG